MSITDLKYSANRNSDKEKISIRVKDMIFFENTISETHTGCYLVSVSVTTLYKFCAAMYRLR